MPATETVVLTVDANREGALRLSSNVLALIAPEKTGAAVSANVVRKYAEASEVGTDHDGTSEDSLLTAGADAAFRSGARRLFAVSAAETVVSAEAAGTGSGTLANTPVTSIEDVVGKTVTYTTKTGGDFTALTPGAGEAIVNMKTGEIKVDSGTITVDYTYHDWDTAFDALDIEAYETVAPAGYSVSAKNWGVWSKVLSHAQSQDKLVVGAFDSGIEATDVDPAIDDVSDIVTEMRDDRVILVAAHYTGDLTSAAAAQVTSRPSSSTRKEQIAPAGVTYTDTYKRVEFGDHESPAATTFHSIGANAIYRDEFGEYRWSNYRTTQPISNLYAYGEVYREQRAFAEDLKQSLLNARRATDTGMGITSEGLAGVESIIRSAARRHQRLGNLNPDFTPVVVVPDFDEISASDKQNGIVPNTSVTVKLAKQIMLIKLKLNVSL